jgi:hypothetical protein
VPDGDVVGQAEVGDGDLLQAELVPSDPESMAQDVDATMAQQRSPRDARAASFANRSAYEGMRRCVMFVADVIRAVALSELSPSH